MKEVQCHVSPHLTPDPTSESLINHRTKSTERKKRLETAGGVVGDGGGVSVIRTIRPTPLLTSDPQI